MKYNVVIVNYLQSYTNMCSVEVLDYSERIYSRQNTLKSSYNQNPFKILIERSVCKAFKQLGIYFLTKIKKGV